MWRWRTYVEIEKFETEESVARMYIRFADGTWETYWPKFFPTSLSFTLLLAPPRIIIGLAGMKSGDESDGGRSRLGG